MKYVIALVVVVILVRIDIFLGLFEKAKTSVEKRSAPVVQPNDVSAPGEIISIKDDKAIKQTPRGKFFALLENFSVNPRPESRQFAIDILKKTPSVLTPKLDKEFEGAIFRWRDLIPQNNPELPLFLNDLTDNLMNENLDAVKRFYSLIMDHNMSFFLKSYAKTKDVNCTIGALFGDAYSDEAKYNELGNRISQIKVFLSQENIDPAQKLLAENCLLVLNVEYPKFTPPATEPEPENP